MATQEVNKPSSLPSPSEMILAAIEALGDKSGSSKTAIAKQIESAHGAGAISESKLTEILDQMKDNGELLFSKNNYLRGEPVTPAKRGRGRPPKPKSATSVTPAAVPSGPPRPRGRPPKQRDPLAVTATPPKAAASSGGSGRGRGRPPKNKKAASPAQKEKDDDDDEADVEEPEPESPMTTTTTVVTGTGTPRGRGRPPKVKPQVAAVGV